MLNTVFYSFSSEMLLGFLPKHFRNFPRVRLANKRLGKRTWERAGRSFELRLPLVASSLQLRNWQPISDKDNWRIGNRSNQETGQSEQPEQPEHAHRQGIVSGFGMLQMRLQLREICAHTGGEANVTWQPAPQLHVAVALALAVAIVC